MELHLFFGHVKHLVSSQTTIMECITAALIFPVRNTLIECSWRGIPETIKTGQIWSFFPSYLCFLRLYPLCNGAFYSMEIQSKKTVWETSVTTTTQDGFYFLKLEQLHHCIHAHIGWFAMRLCEPCLCLQGRSDKHVICKIRHNAAVSPFSFTQGHFLILHVGSSDTEKRNSIVSLIEIFKKENQC